jgi:hypothetical protein
MSGAHRIRTNVRAKVLNLHPGLMGVRVRVKSMSVDHRRRT